MKAGPTALAAAVTLASAAMAEDNALSFRLGFSPDTATALAARGEKVVISAFYYGFPKPGATAELDEMGQVWLGNEEIEVDPVDQLIILAGRMDGPADQVLAPTVNINVFTARRTDPNNLIACGIVEGPIAEIAAAEQRIDCTLLGP